MIFDNIPFIKANRPFQREYTGKNTAPLFRKTFTITKCSEAKLAVCGLGYGYYYINGKKVSGDLFTAPVSDYTKTLWYQVYDVTDLLKEGENVIAAVLGNGFYNEEFHTVWEHETAPWRDNPKCILSLTIDGELIVATDSTWKCLPESATYFNALRSGEHFDARKYDKNWCELHYDDSHWENAAEDTSLSSVTFRECVCEPIREIEVLKAKTVTQTDENTYVFDFGKNMSGYVRLSIAGTRDDEIILHYDEDVRPEFIMRGTLSRYFPESEFQTDRFICSGKPLVWSPKFAYHGFRYITVSGIRSLNDISVEAVKVHQDIRRKTTFQCSDELLNRMFEAGVASSYSNMFYMMTDCPTREKYGWANDAQSSCEQLLTNFHIEKFFRKWLYDVYDAMREDGMMPGIIPTPGWGYDWGNGPVSDGLLFELPLRLYLHTGDTAPLSESLEYFDRYFAMIETKKDENELVGFGLDDWANPGFQKLTPAEFVNAVLLYEFYAIAALAAKFKGVDTDRYESLKAHQKQIIFDNYLTEDGTCKVNEQSAVAMLIYFDLYEELAPLKQQLLSLIEAENYHHKCGMVGLRRLFLALNICGEEETAYKILTVSGYPSYKTWFDYDATTLWETWNDEGYRESSRNHHMYSDFMSWLMKTPVGIRINPEKPGSEAFLFDPKFLQNLSFVKASYETKKGTILIDWKKAENAVSLSVTVPDGIELLYNGSCLSAGENRFQIPLF